MTFSTDFLNNVKHILIHVSVLLNSILSHNNPGVKWYMLYNSPAEALEGDVFVDEEGSDGEENEEFYPDDCQWEQEEEPVKPGPTAVATEKVTLMIHLHKTVSLIHASFVYLFSENILTLSY